MISKLVFRIVLLFSRLPKRVLMALGWLILLTPLVATVIGKLYQGWDDDPQRGAIAMADGKFGEDYQVPEYLDQGWDENGSLWFYNTTQGSALLPYAFLLALEQPENQPEVKCSRHGETDRWLLCPKNMDDFRYLPQKASFFNPDALPVGFVKEKYRGRDYVGLTCAACHTGQVNFGNRALRIDGGPAMADMVGFLTSMTAALEQTLGRPDGENPRRKRFVDRVLALGGDFDNAAAVESELQRWTDIRKNYNVINDSRTDQCVFPEQDYRIGDCEREGFISHEVDYGYARLDAFGRIYNRVLQHAINIAQVEEVLKSVTRFQGKERILTDAQIKMVLDGIGHPGDAVLKDGQFNRILANLASDAPGYPDLSRTDMLRVRNAIFNPPNAPVSYPFLWDITHSDYVQWNGLAGNSLLGPLGRNAGEVIGVFGMLDWHTDSGLSRVFKGLSLPAYLTGQKKKAEVINFRSSVDLFNLQRLESHLVSLTSPAWPFCVKNRGETIGDYYLPDMPESLPVDRRDCASGDLAFNTVRLERGRVLFAAKCQSCHDVIDPKAFDRIMISKMVGISHKETTDETMARNGVNYAGKAGNFKDTYQETEVGTLVVRENAPVVQILTAATTGVVATPDPDKWWLQRIYDWLYTVIMSVFDNPIAKSTVKAGVYTPDTTAKPYASLLSYRGRSLNGIWATAPYLHNGSVPTLYDLVSCVEERPVTFRVGSRQFDPVKVGFKSEGYDGFNFDTRIAGNSNKGHDYGACKLSHEDRMSLVEYMKSL